MSSEAEDVSVLEGPSELIGGLELDGIAVAVKIDRDQLYDDDKTPLLASDLSREVAATLEAVERGEEQPELVADGGLPFDEEDIIVRRARIQPGPGGEDDDDPELVTDGGAPDDPEAWRSRLFDGDGVDNPEGVDAELDAEAIVQELESRENRGVES